MLTLLDLASIEIFLTIFKAMGEEDITKIYVGGLTYSTTDKELWDLFANYGDVKNAYITKDRESGDL